MCKTKLYQKSQKSHSSVFRHFIRGQGATKKETSSEPEIFMKDFQADFVWVIFAPTPKKDPIFSILEIFAPKFIDRDAKTVSDKVINVLT